MNEYIGKLKCALFLTLALTTGMAWAQKKPEIRLSYLTNVSRSFEIAYKNGKFESDKYKLIATEVQSGGQIASLVGGQQDVVFTEYANMVAAVKNGVNIVYVTPISMQVPRAYFLTRGNAKFKPNDLKGKKVGIGVGAFYQLHTTKWLNSLGYSASLEEGKADVLLVKVNDMALPGALQAGNVDVVHTWDRIYAYQWVQDYKFTFFEGTEGGVDSAKLGNLNAPAGGWGTTKEFLAKNGAALEALDADMRAAINWYEQKIDPAEQRKLWISVGGRDFQSLSKSVSPEVFDSLIRLRSAAPVVGEKFDPKVIGSWIDQMSEITGITPKANQVDLKSTMAPWLWK